jgi:hypothetical protein
MINRRMGAMRLSHLPRLGAFLTTFGAVVPGLSFAPAIAPALGVWAGGCHESDCNCVVGNGGLIVEAQQGAVQSIVTGGPACVGAEVLCNLGNTEVAAMSGCAEYRVVPTRGGNCELTAKLGDGSMVQETVVMTATSGCCGVMWTSAPYVWDITEPDGGSSQSPTDQHCDGASECE